MESRRRQPSASTSTSYSTEDIPKAHGATRRASTSSMPPGDDGEESSQRRATRNRNPLPPTSGPLFPPLPPKPPRNSPKNSPKTPKTDRPTPQPRTSLSANPIQPGSEPEHIIEQGAELSTLKVEDAQSGSRQSSPSGSTSKQDQLIGSVTSLTPPPPTSEDNGLDPDLEMEVDPPEDNADNGVEDDSGANGGESEDWDTYQQHRRVRGFVAATNGVKLEPEEENDNEITPRRNESQREGASLVRSPSASGRETSAARSRRRRGEEQLLLDDHLLPEEMRKTGSLTGKRGKGNVKDEEELEEGEKADGEAEGEEDDDEEREDLTRCVCKTEDNDVMMIQCDKCNVWQHGPCVGIWSDGEAPDEYFCEQCRPDLHSPLRKWMRSRGRNVTHFVPPTPQDLQKFHSPSDRIPPSQSTRWPPAQPPSPPRPPPRSHHRKETGSPVDLTDGRRSTRGRVVSVPSAKPVSSGKDKQKDPQGGRRNVSIASPSPPTSPPSLQPAKRRSTMNSRDAAYEEQVQAALEASRKDSVPRDHEEGEDVEAELLEEEAVDDDKEQARKGKRKRDEDETGSDTGTAPPASGNSKPKHPNQYTYRPKPPSATQAPTAAASPARRIGQASTPVPTLPPPAQHEHGTRRAGAIANGTIPPPANSISVHNLHWHLPDHLSAFSDLLPSNQPIALESRAPRQLAYLPRNHFHNQKYGPFTEDRDESGKLSLPTEQTSRDPISEPITQLEPPARVRYPARRITTAEMRKRVRNVLEYVGRVQVEETKRKERAKLVGIDHGNLAQARRLDREVDNPEEGDIRPSLMFNQGSTSDELMDELMRDLIGFQETFNAAAGFVSPMPPAVSAFTPVLFPGSAPVTPQPPHSSTMAEAEVTEPADTSDQQVDGGNEEDNGQTEETKTANGMETDQVTAEPEDISEVREPVQVADAAVIQEPLDLDTVEASVPGTTDQPADKEGMSDMAMPAETAEAGNVSPLVIQDIEMEQAETVEA